MNDQERALLNLLKLDNDLQKQEIARLERQVQEYKEENVKLLKAVLKLHSEIRKAHQASGKVLEDCDNNVWFTKLKERTY